VAFVISNDSDLTEPIRVVRDELKLPIGVLCPHDNPSRQLRNAATFWREIRDATLAKAQFADMLSDARGAFQARPVEQRRDGTPEPQIRKARKAIAVGPGQPTRRDAFRG
jgi:hypothetical protein